MRFVMMVKHAENSGPPPKPLMDAIAKLSEEDSKAGRMIESGGLAPTAQSARGRLSRGQLTVVDGPFTEAKEVVGGYAIIAFKSKEEVLGLVALMQIQASSSGARIGPSGEPVLLLDQDRAHWDQLLMRRGLAALAPAEKLGSTRGPYALQASIAACHGGNGLGAHRGTLRCARPALAIPRRGSAAGEGLLGTRDSIVA